MKRIIALFIVAALCGCGRQQSAGGAPPTITIGVSLLNVSNEFIVMLNQAMQAKADELVVKLLVNDAQGSAERQVQQVESFIAQHVDVIILNPCEVAASSPAVDKAVAAGIPIVNMNSETQSAPTAFVGSRDEESGRLAMECIAKHLNGKGNVLMIEGVMGQAAQIKRAEGARAILAEHPGLKMLAAQTAEWDRAKAMSLMENWIQAHGQDIQAVFAQNDEMAMGALLALERAKLKDKVVLVGVDAIADALLAVKEGRLDATVFQDARQQGASAVDSAVKLARHQPCDKQSLIPYRLVTKANISQF